MWSGLFIPDPDADFLTSRIQGSKRHPIPDPDPQHWFPSNVLCPDPHLCWSAGSGSGFVVRIRIMGKMTRKKKLGNVGICFDVLDVLFWGLEAFPRAWTFIKEPRIPIVNSYNFWVINSLDPIRIWPKMLDPDPGIETNLDPRHCFQL